MERQSFGLLVELQISLLHWSEYFFTCCMSSVCTSFRITK
uniref:Uncharacterized protein n=1 Tax=Arundo donax TaxID=35708 RepID=A0A0A9FZN1_ARUDO